MKHCRLNVLTVLSLLLCLAVVVLWVASYGQARDLLTATVRGERFTARSHGGRLVVSGPPAGPRSAPVSNDSVTWYVHQHVPKPAFLWWFPPPVARFVTFTTSGAVPSQRQLLSDLHDPERFVAAHLLLAYSGTIPGPPGSPAANKAHWNMSYRLESGGIVEVTPQPDGGCVATIDGLRVVLSPIEGRGRYTEWVTFSISRRRDFGTVYIISVASADIDPAQLPAIRDQWHRRLVGPRWSIPHWPLAAALLVLPAAWSVVLVHRQLQSRADRRRGHCRV